MSYLPGGYLQAHGRVHRLRTHDAREMPAQVETPLQTAPPRLHLPDVPRTVLKTQRWHVQLHVQRRIRADEFKSLFKKSIQCKIRVPE